MMIRTAKYLPTLLLVATICACDNVPPQHNDSTSTDVTSALKKLNESMYVWRYGKTVESKSDVMNDEKWTETHVQASLEPNGYWDDVSNFAGASLSISKTERTTGKSGSKSWVTIALFPTSGTLASRNCLDTCRVRLRFDDKPPIQIEFSSGDYKTPEGKPSRFMTAPASDEVITALKTASTLKIEVPYVPNNGSLDDFKMIVSEFKVTGFVLD